MNFISKDKGEIDYLYDYYDYFNININTQDIRESGNQDQLVTGAVPLKGQLFTLFTPKKLILIS